MRNLELTNNGGMITVKALAGKGSVFLTYNISTSLNSKNQGSFTGQGIVVEENGKIELSTRGGVWTQEETTLTLHLLDDLADGSQHPSKSTLDLSSGRFAMIFYRM